MSAPVPQLSDSERSILSARADQFFDALSQGNAGDWRPFLDGLDTRVRPVVLTELIIIEMGHRWANGERPAVEDYMERFPEIGPADQVPPKLILEEHLCRIKAGEPADLANYRERFPKQFPAIESELVSRAQQNQTRVSSSAPAMSSGPSSNTTRSDGVLSVSQQYEFVKELGRGMFGEVWLARKKPSGIEKAVKILLQPADRDAAKRELRSLELIKNLRHPYLLATEDFWVADNRLHVVMELADGTLRTRFKECRQQMLPGIPEDELLNYFQEAAEGLDYLHTMKITHRDVKPDNILLLHGHAKVADFGLARHQDAIMASMSFAGTPAYMAPEIWGGEGGPASDQYSLAFTYSELRQGKVPISPKASLQEMMLAHLDGRFEFDPHVIGEAEQVVLRKAMARDPDERYPSCSIFVEELAISLGRSFLRKSHKIPMPSPREQSPTGESPLSLTESAKHKSLKSTGTDQHQATRTVTGSQTSHGTKTGTGTVTERPTITPQTKSVIGPRRPKAKGKVSPSRPKVLLAVILTGVLASVVAGMLYVMFFHNDHETLDTSDTGRKSTDQLGTGSGQSPVQDTQRPFDTKKHNGTMPTSNGNMNKPTIVIPNGGYEQDEGAVAINLVSHAPAYDSIVYKLSDDTVRFRLIARPNSNVKPFYISESKISSGLYRKNVSKISAPFRQQPNGSSDDTPIFNVSAMEAADFARQVFPGGRLPSPSEWDEAAGLYDPQPLIKAGGKAHVKSLSPASTGRGRTMDENVNKLLDMAGNGSEWTRAIVMPGSSPVQIVDRDQFDDKDLVVLRGRRYTLADPLTKERLHYEQTVPQTQFAGVPNAFTSFRVVVPLP